MWSVDKLREVVALRGETESDAHLGKLLLMHERYRGRTEEDVSRDDAKRALDSLLDLQTSPLPGPSIEEYPGLKQLRGYASDRRLQRAGQKTKDVPREIPPRSFPTALAEIVRANTREKEQDRG